MVLHRNRRLAKNPARMFGIRRVNKFQLPPILSLLLSFKKILFWGGGEEAKAVNDLLVDVFSVLSTASLWMNRSACR